MPLEPAFVTDFFYGEGGLLLDEILLVDKETGTVRARMPTHDDLPITREQKVHPVRHPRHVSGGLMVHMTGVMGFVHAYYVLGLRHAEGWVGYGGKIHSARFKAIARPGEPMELECTPKQVRRLGAGIFARYAFHFYQGGVEVYEGDQTAMWLRPEAIEEGATILGVDVSAPPSK